MVTNVRSRTQCRCFGSPWKATSSDSLPSCTSPRPVMCTFVESIKQGLEGQMTFQRFEINHTAANLGFPGIGGYYFRPLQLSLAVRRSRP